MLQVRQALIARSDEAFAGELGSLLSSLGFKVTTVVEPAQVLETLGSRRFELALINAVLPGLSWSTSYRAMKEASRTTTVVMISVSAEQAAIRSAISSGSYVALAWPLTQEQLSILVAPESDGLFIALKEYQ